MGSLLDEIFRQTLGIDPQSKHSKDKNDYYRPSHKTKAERATEKFFYDNKVKQFEAKNNAEIMKLRLKSKGLI